MESLCHVLVQCRQVLKDGVALHQLGHDLQPRQAYPSTKDCKAAASNEPARTLRAKRPSSFRRSSGNCFPVLMQPATTFGLMWTGLVIAAGMVANIGSGVVAELLAVNPAQATLVWLNFDVFSQRPVGGRNEIIGGLWLLLISPAALRDGGSPRRWATSVRPSA
jgi:hypothetical protein